MRAKRIWGETIKGFDCTKYPGAPSSFVTVHLALTKPTGCLSLLLPSTLFSQTASVCSPSELFNFVYSTWPEEDPVERPCRSIHKGSKGMEISLSTLARHMGSS